MVAFVSLKIMTKIEIAVCKLPKREIGFKLFNIGISIKLKTFFGIGQNKVGKSFNLQKKKNKIKIDLFKRLSLYILVGIFYC